MPLLRLKTPKQTGDALKQNSEQNRGTQDATADILTDSSLAAAVAMAPFDSGFDPRQRRRLIRAHLVSQMIRVQLVLLD